MRAATTFAACVVIALLPDALQASTSPQEAYRAVPMPRGVRVEVTELDGPVFADSKGKTLYRWPLRNLRSGTTGDPVGISQCTNTRTEVSAGLMSPYPGGLRLPDLEQRVSCAQVWPPFQADKRASPIGKWTIIKRNDGTQQWAYDGLPLYTFHLDQRPGDVLGGRAGKRGNDSPVLREPVGPPSDVPPGFGVRTMSTGRLLVTEDGFSIYASDHDAPGKSNCSASCTEKWLPLLAPATGRPRGEWTLIEHSAGVKQWAFRGSPLYRYGPETDTHDFQGSDVPGWHNVYVQRAPPPPAEFTVQDTSAGQVLADRNGMTLYAYFCGDDSLDQLPCDHPSQTQAYRLTVCGGGDAERCLRTFPYAVAGDDAKATSRSWTVMTIDPMTGRRATPGQSGALRVWAFRDRPLYTYAGDRRPGDTHADAHGEFRGLRNGFRAIWLRDEFFGADQPGPG